MAESEDFVQLDSTDNANTPPTSSQPLPVSPRAKVSPADKTAEDIPNNIYAISLDAPVYHEKQKWMRCGIHAVNNLRPIYDKTNFDAICAELTPDAMLNPHKSVLGIGNYDINVLMFAINQEGYEVRWHDRRRSLSTIAYPLLFGCIINKPTLSFFPLYPSTHWYTIRPFGAKQLWYELDSKKPVRLIGGPADVASFLREQLDDGYSQLFLVTEKDLTVADIYSVELTSPNYKGATRPPIPPRINSNNTTKSINRSNSSSATSGTSSSSSAPTSSINSPVLMKAFSTNVLSGVNDDRKVNSKYKHDNDEKEEKKSEFYYEGDEFAI